MSNGIVFNIQKCSIHDGPGIRTLVFLKGCYLSCQWCANPESQKFKPEIMNFYSKCIGCGQCYQICPFKAIYKSAKGFAIDREKCSDCGLCVEECYAESKKIMGKEMSPDQVFQEIRKDKVFYKGIANGGVTFSGGEPFLHADFLKETCQKCKDERINTAVETCGYAEFDQIKEVLPYLDSIFFDIKHYNTDLHKKYTGQSNEKILDNLKKINEYNIPITVRTPIIPGCNDSEKNIMEIAKICAALSSVKQYELLAYHELGLSKYDSLERPYLLRGVKTPKLSEMEKLVKIANEILNPLNKECVYKH